MLYLKIYNPELCYKGLGLGGINLGEEENDKNDFVITSFTVFVNLCHNPKRWI